MFYKLLFAVTSVLEKRLVDNISTLDLLMAVFIFGHLTGKSYKFLTAEKRFQYLLIPTTQTQEKRK